MPEHKVGTHEEYDAARAPLLAEGKELTPRGDELAKKWRELPWVRVEKDYWFETEDGTKTLADLLDGRSQLMVYDFMFGPSWTAGCPVCSSIADTVAPQVPHLNAKDTTLMLFSRAPPEKLLAYRKRMGSAMPWRSSGGSDFNRGLGIQSTEEKLRPFLEGEAPLTVEQDPSRGCAAPICPAMSRGGRAERVRAIGRDCLSDLRDVRSRSRDRDGLLRAAQPDAERPRRAHRRPPSGSVGTPCTAKPDRLGRPRCSSPSPTRIPRTTAREDPQDG